MKNHMINARMAGILYFLGTAFGIMSVVIGGDVIASLIKTVPLDHLNLDTLYSSRLLGAALFTLLMGISLVAMTAFLYPIFRKDSEELALGMLLFRGALEGTFYFITTLSILGLFTLGEVYSKSTEGATLQILADTLYHFQNVVGPVGTICFLIGATCLYASFYRTRLIPRWISIWGFIGVIPYMVYAILHLFNLDNGIGFYLQMLLAPQEIVMALWLIVKGFDSNALKALHC